MPEGSRRQFLGAASVALGALSWGTEAASARRVGDGRSSADVDGRATSGAVEGIGVGCEVDVFESSSSISVRRLRDEEMEYRYIALVLGPVRSEVSLTPQTAREIAVALRAAVDTDEVEEWTTGVRSVWVEGLAERINTEQSGDGGLKIVSHTGNPRGCRLETVGTDWGELYASLSREAALELADELQAAVEGSR